MRNKLILCLILLTVLIGSGCTIGNDPVPTGHIGRVYTPSGFNDEIHRPGRVSCWGRDVLYLMETTDEDFVISGSVLTKDRLNFAFTLTILTTVNTAKDDVVKAVFEDLKPAAPGGEHGQCHEGTFTVQQLFDTYVKNPATEAVKEVFSQYRSEGVIDNREEVAEKLVAAVKLASEDVGILTIKRVTLSNIDYPSVIINAQNMRKQREVEIETAKAEAEKRRQQANADLHLAKVRAQRKLIEAQSLADQNRLIADSITPEFLAFEQIRAMKDAARNPSTLLLMPYNDSGSPSSGDTVAGTAKKSALTAELIQRLNDAKASQATPPPAPEPVNSETAEPTSETSQQETRPLLIVQ